MKKLLVCLLAAGTLVSAMAGCTTTAPTTTDGGDTATTEDTTPAEDSAEATTEEGGLDINEDGTINNPEDVVIEEGNLVFWSLFSGGDGEFMEQIIDDYNASDPTQPVQAVLLPWGDYYTKLMTAVAADKGPDIGVSHASRLPEMVQNGIIMPIDDVASSAGVDLSQYSNVAVDGSTLDGSLYAIPLDTHAEILYYNTDLLAAAGIPLEADGTVKIDSWDDFTALLTQAKDSLPEGSTAMSLTQDGDDPWRVWWAIYFSMGGTPIVNEDSTEVTMDRDIAIAAAQTLYSWYTEGLIIPAIEDHQQFFQGGNGVFEFGGTWAVGVYESTEGFNYGAMTAPIDFGTPTAWADLHTFTLPVNGDRTDEESLAAMEFISYATSTGAEIWAQSGQIPAYTPVVEGESYNALPHRSTYASAADIAVLPPNTAIFGAIKTAMIATLDTVWLGQEEVGVAIDNMIAEIESNL